MGDVTVRMTLLLGSSVPTPAPMELMLAFQNAVVRVPDAGPITFQLTFRTEGTKAWSSTNAIVGHSLLQPFTRCAIVATVGLTPTLLVDGYLTHQQLVPSSAGQAGGFTVSGEDVGVLLDVEEKSSEFKGMDTKAIVESILMSYLLDGILPKVSAPPVTDAPLPAHETRLQNGTDRAYIQALAAEVGFVTYVSPGTLPGMNTFYFGPGIRTGVPQAALSYDQGPYTNVDQLQLEYDPRRPTRAVAQVVDEDVSAPPSESVSISTSTLASMSARPALTSLPSRFLRTTLVNHGGDSPARTRQRAQGIVDASVRGVAVASGSLRVSRYGRILRCRELVSLRGAGKTWDGTWYVRSVSHDLSQKGYTQSFSLERDGLGATASLVRTS